jgi:hypothetical protein
MTIRWGSLIADPTGEIDYSKVRSFTSVALAWCAGIILCAVMTGLLMVQTDLVMIGVGALVLPLTGGKVTDALAAMATRKAEKADA